MEWEEKYVKAGKIAKKARKLGISLVKEGVKYLEVARKVEEYIINDGANFAFPINISVNNIAAHDSPSINDERVFKEGDVVKIDVGVHIDGYIADTAETTEVKTKNNQDMIKNNKEILSDILSKVNPETKLCDIGKFIQKKANERGYNTIINLTGHQLKQYVLHAGIIIPNYDNGSNKKIGVGAFAIEPFFTKGEGYVVHDKPSQIYRIEEVKGVRLNMLREILKFIIKNYRSLPFSKRWVAEKFGENKTNMAFNYFMKEGILVNYPVLREVSNEKVSQFEHTIIIKEDSKIITTL